MPNPQTPNPQTPNPKSTTRSGLRLTPLTLIAFLLAFCIVGTPANLAAADEPLPDNYNADYNYNVDYNFFSGIPFELTNPGGSLPGSNDWNCVPTQEHPEPVVLVHGTGGGAQTNWGTFVPLLKNEGYCVFALTYGALKDAPWPLSSIGGLGPIENSAVELRLFVDKVLEATGAKKIDIVGHSQGTFMPTYYAKFLGGEKKIDKYISLAPLWQGSQADIGVDLFQSIPAKIIETLANQGIIINCEFCINLSQNPATIHALQAEYPYLPTISYTNIMTRYDEVVVPYSSGYFEAKNATNIVVQDWCPLDFSDHAALAASPIAAVYVLNALDPNNPRPIPCEFVPPFTG